MMRVARVRGITEGRQGAR